MGDTQVAEGAGCRVYWKLQSGRKTIDKNVLRRDGIDITKYEKEGKPFRAFRPYFLREGE